MGVLLVELLTKMITFPNSNMNELLAMSLAVHPFSFRSVSLSVRAFVQFFIRQWANSHEDESHHGRDHYHQQLGDRNTILLCVVKYDCSSIYLTFCRLYIFIVERNYRNASHITTSTTTLMWTVIYLQCMGMQGFAVWMLYVISICIFYMYAYVCCSYVCFCGSCKFNEISVKLISGYD